MPAGVHTYYHKPVNGTREDPESHLAAFLLARSEYWYYFGSTGWLDSDFVWSAWYDKAAACGRPKDAAKEVNQVFTRQMEGCRVTLDCAKSAGCIGKIDFD